jgi:hypothetical protein
MVQDPSYPDEDADCPELLPVGEQDALEAQVALSAMEQGTSTPVSIPVSIPVLIGESWPVWEMLIDDAMETEVELRDSEPSQGDSKPIEWISSESAESLVSDHWRSPLPDATGIEQAIARQ